MDLWRYIYVLLLLKSKYLNLDIKQQNYNQLHSELLQFKKYNIFGENVNIEFYIQLYIWRFALSTWFVIEK